LPRRLDSGGQRQDFEPNWIAVELDEAPRQLIAR